MTLRQKVFLKKLPENNFNMKKTMEASGYSAATTRAGSQYKILRKHTQDFYDPDYVKKELKKEIKRMRKEKDNTNFCRLFEMKAKIAIPELRKQEVITNQPKEITVIYGNNTPQPIDIPKDTAISPS